MGKGDKRRPTVVDDRSFQQAWERVFGPKPVSAEREPEKTTDQPQGAKDEDRP